MASPRNKLKRPRMIKHRELVLCNAVANILTGKSSVSYAHTRWIKLKQIRGK